MRPVNTIALYQFRAAFPSVTLPTHRRPTYPLESLPLYTLRREPLRAAAARESRWLHREAGSFRMVNRIEELLPPTPQLGADTCMRALAAVLWRRTRDDGDWDTWPWIRRFVPALAKADGRLPYPADLSARRILEELVAADLGGFANQFSGTVSIAQEILRRLDFTGHPVLSDDDEQAPAVIGAFTGWLLRARSYLDRALEPFCRA